MQLEQLPAELPLHPSRYVPGEQPPQVEHGSDPDDDLYLPEAQLEQVPSELPLHP